MTPAANPILEAKVRTVKPDDFSAPHILRQEPAAGSAMDLRRLFRRQSASDFVGKVRPGMHTFCLSKGQFSLVDVLRELSNQVGPADLALSTWTVAHADLEELQGLCTEARFTRLRFLLDFSFQRRQPALLGHIRKTYGPEAVLVTRNHAKFLLLRTPELRLTVRTSMNLNFNPRLEDVEIKECAALHGFLEAILDDLFAAHDKKAQAGKSSAELSAEFARLTL